MILAKHVKQHLLHELGGDRCDLSPLAGGWRYWIYEKDEQIAHGIIDNSVIKPIDIKPKKGAKEDVKEEDEGITSTTK